VTTDPMDRALARRLSGLLEAVPVAAAPQVAIPRNRVTTRLSVGVASLAVVLVALIAALALGSRAPAVGGPVVGVATDGPFKLTITVPHARYSSDQSITGVTASLEYAGQHAVQINHAAGGPLAFAVASADGRHETQPTWDLACARSTLTPGNPATAGYAKTGGYFPEESDYPWLSAFFSSPSLILDSGRWTITVIAEFSEGGCGGTAHEIRASVVIGVGDALAATPTPGPSSSADGSILSVSQVLAARAAGGLKHQTVEVQGWWSNALIPHSCVPSLDPVGELEIRCSDGEFGITEADEPIEVVDQFGYVTQAGGPHLTPYIANDLADASGLFSLPFIHGQRFPPVPIVVIGHFDDPRASQCGEAKRQLCMDRLVVDRIVSFDVGSVATPAPSPTPTPFPSPAPPALFGASQCDGDVPYAFVGWTTTKDLNIEFDRPGHVFAMVTRDVVQLTDGWQEDGNGSGHRFQIWGQHVCLAEEDPHNPGAATSMSFSSVMGTQYVLWDDGLRTPGTNAIRANAR
jgi:hypothetical protein